MANAIYPNALKLFLDGDVDLLSDNIKITLIDLNDYTFAASHDFYDDIPLAARVATSGNLTGKATTVSGSTCTFSANNVTFPTVTGDPSEAIVVWRDTGTAATSALLFFVDSTSDASLPVLPNGGNINIEWGAGGIYTFTGL